MQILDETCIEIFRVEREAPGEREGKEKDKEFRPICEARPRGHPRKSERDIESSIFIGDSGFISSIWLILISAFNAELLVIMSGCVESLESGIDSLE
jgi:hypothetical protein